MSSASTCSDALALVEKINARNEQLLKDYQGKVAEYDNKINAVSIPSTNVGDYPQPETGEYYACDDARKDRHRSECSNKSNGVYPSGSFEWTGNEWTTWGGGPCRKTNAKCFIKQSYIDALAKEQRDKKNTLIAEKNTLKQESLEVPKIECCQSMEFNNLKASDIKFDNVTQSCTKTINPPANTGTGTGIGSNASNVETETSDNSIYIIGIMIFILILILLIVLVM